MACTSCRSKSLIRDDVSGNLACSSCGTLQEFDSFEAHIGGINGPQGTYIRVGTAGTGSVFNYREKKIFDAQKLIEELTFKLGLTGSKSNEIKTMIDNITQGEFGQGDWFPILIGACSYVVMRRDNRSLPIAEVASVIGCDIHELGRMIGRVADFLNLKLPEYDIVNSFERAIKNLSSLGSVSREKVGRMRKQGIFLLQCAVKWFLTTGRRPVPMVAAVLTLAAELNEVDVRIEDVAKEVHAAVATSRLRYKELLEALVNVAQALPWGKDITIKNIVKNAPLVIHYMEMKSMIEPGKKMESERVEFDLRDVVSECLRKDVKYGTNVNSEEYDSQYFEVEGRSGFTRSDVGDMDNLKISHECLSMIYTKFSNEVDGGKSMGVSENVHGRKRRRGVELHACKEWWNGKSELSKKLLLKQILEKDVGLNAMPPSFVNGCMAIERRKVKINAAKLRIDKIMYPSKADSVDGSNFCLSDHGHAGKKRKGARADDIDWEDFIIETLLLHKVKEEEIEKGYYNTLLDLHVFNSGIM